MYDTRKQDEALANYNNTPQARRMMHVVIRNLVEQMQPYVDERLE